MKKIIVPIIHGVEVVLEEGYCAKFLESVEAKIPAIYKEYIVLYPFSWHLIVSERQRRTYQIEADLGLSRLRNLSVQMACDILWYRSSKGMADGQDVYSQIHSKLATELELLIARHGKDAHVVALGHSLGSQIALDHAFETQRRVDALFTMGSPITKYSGMFPDWGHLPPKGLEFWVNFYMNRDLVASSFKNHPSDSIRNLVTDFKVTSWNPLNFPILKQHVYYWKSSDVHSVISSYLVNYLLKINKK